MTMVIMVTDGYRWLFMVINDMCISTVQWLSWLLVVTSGYLWLLATLRNNNNGYHGMVIDGYLWLLMCISTVQWLSWLLVVPSHY